MKQPRGRLCRRRRQGKNKPPPPSRSSKTDGSHYRERYAFGKTKAWIIVCGIQSEDNMWTQIEET